MNIYIVNGINLCGYTQGVDFALENSLSGAVKLTKEADFDKYTYCGFGIGFDVRGSFLLSDSSGFFNFIWS